MRGTTPRKLSSSIRRFLESLESVGTATWLPFSFVSSDYQAAYCLSNCEAEHRRTGATIVFGWLIWEIRTQSFIEAEFHAVVKRGGVLEDITPRNDAEKLVMFVPDFARRAVRRDDRTWDTWANHKKQGSALEPTRPILLQDFASNVLA